MQADPRVTLEVRGREQLPNADFDRVRSTAALHYLAGRSFRWFGSISDGAPQRWIDPHWSQARCVERILKVKRCSFDVERATQGNSKPRSRSDLWSTNKAAGITLLSCRAPADDSIGERALSFFECNHGAENHLLVFHTEHIGSKACA